MCALTASCSYNVPQAQSRPGINEIIMKAIGNQSLDLINLIEQKGPVCTLVQSTEPNCSTNVFFKYNDYYFQPNTFDLEEFGKIVNYNVFDTLPQKEEGTISFHIKNEYSLSKDNEMRKMPSRNAGGPDIAIRDTVISIRQTMPIQIFQPEMSAWECTYPWIYSQDIEVRWNADIENDHGMIIIAAWSGDMIEGDDVENYSYKAVLVEDNGCATLNNELFNEIPSGAFTRLIFVRANALTIEMDGSDVTLEHESHLDLVREDYPEVFSQLVTVGSVSLFQFAFILTHEI